MVITKQSKNKLEYIQELAIRYLKPPSPPISGDIIITKEPDVLPSPAPPLIIRQQPVILPKIFCKEFFFIYSFLRLALQLQSQL